jgi:hypothetical protein
MFLSGDLCLGLFVTQRRRVLSLNIGSCFLNQVLIVITWQSILRASYEVFHDFFVLVVLLFMLIIELFMLIIELFLLVVKLILKHLNLIL